VSVALQVGVFFYNYIFRAVCTLCFVNVIGSKCVMCNAGYKFAVCSSIVVWLTQLFCVARAEEFQYSLTLLHQENSSQPLSPTDRLFVDEVINSSDCVTALLPFTHGIVAVRVLFLEISFFCIYYCFLIMVRCIDNEHIHESRCWQGCHIGSFGAKKHKFHSFEKHLDAKFLFGYFLALLQLFHSTNFSWSRVANGTCSLSPPQ